MATLQDILSISICTTSLIGFVWFASSLFLCIGCRFMADLQVARARRADKLAFRISLNRASYRNLQALSSAMGLPTKGYNREQLHLRLDAILA